MGKKQPKFNNKRNRKKYKNHSSSKKSQRSHNWASHSKSNFNPFMYKNSHDIKKSSSRKRSKNRNYHENNYNNTGLIINNNSFYNNNYFIFNNFIDNNKKKYEKPEWMNERTEKIVDNNERFEAEIRDYVNYITPKDESLKNRNNTMKTLIKIIKKRKPNWKVHLFGSFKQGTSTVFSDLDFEIIIDDNSSRKHDIEELYFLMKIIRINNFSDNARVIRARVPIIKGTSNATGISLDISVNRHNGYKAAKLIKKIISKHKILRPVIIILKILLKKNNYNEAHTGGMSSFLLFHLVYFFYNISKNNIINNKKEKPKKDIRIVENTFKKSDLLNGSNEKFCEDSNDSNDKDKEEEEEEKSDNKFTITKAASDTDEDFNSNDDDSNLVKNGVSSNDSDFSQKSEEDENNNKLRLTNANNSTDENNDSESNSDDEDKEIEKIEPLLQNDEEYDDISISDFLIGFLYYYGCKFNDNDLGINVLKNDIYLKFKRYDMDCSDTISVESIEEEKKDIGRSCSQYAKIKFLFLSTYNKIKTELNNDTKSILLALDFPKI